MQHIVPKTTWVIDSETEIQVGDEVEIEAINGTVLRGEVTTLNDGWLDIEVSGLGVVNIEAENIEEIEKV